MDLYMSGMTIGELAARTGVGISTLRAWERRYGFPIPDRVPSGHRRYSERDVEHVLAIARERDEGSTLDAAVRRAKARAAAPLSSVFATLRDALPGVAPAALSKPTMLAISRAIEDESATRADAPVFVGTFQEKRFWQRSRRRWQHVAARAELTVALASDVVTREAPRLWEVAVDADSPLAREWAVVCDSPTFAACVVGVERPGRNGGRRFDALWTVEPHAVRAAARTALGIAASAAPALNEAIPPLMHAPAVATYDTIRIATSLTNRIVTYLDREEVSA